MADDNNQELSMEDILSSIKNILAEDEEANNPQKAEPAVQPAVQAPDAAANPAAEDEGDDVLELSPSMRVEEELAPAEEINLDAELDGVSPAAPVLDSAVEEENLPQAPVYPEDDSDPIYEIEAAAAVETEDAEAEMPVAAIPEDEHSDPFYEEENTSYPASEMSFSVEPEEPSAVEPAEVPVFEADAPRSPVVEAEPIAAVATEPVKVVEPEPAAFAEPQPAAAPQSSDAIDVSASIISNFAKMFTRDKAAEPELAEVVPAEPVTELGNAGRTIEDVVAEVIRRIIGAEVEQNWRKGADYDALARQEIAAQTKNWLDKNLPAAVERIVKQEIERVMAKVGDSQ